MNHSHRIGSSERHKESIGILLGNTPMTGVDSFLSYCLLPLGRPW